MLSLCGRAGGTVWQAEYEPMGHKDQHCQSIKVRFWNKSFCMLNFGFGSTNCFIWLDLIQSRLIGIHIQGSQIIIDAHCKMNYSDKLTYQPDHIM